MLVRVDAGVHVGIALVGLPEPLGERASLILDVAPLFACLRLKAVGISSSSLGLGFRFEG